MLPSPVTDRQCQLGTFVTPDGRISIDFGAVSVQGWRRYQEDCCSTSLRRYPDSDDFVYVFSIFDGHGGALVAKRCSELFNDHLLNELFKPFHFPNAPKDASVLNADRVREAFLSFDVSLLQPSYELCGSTATVCIVDTRSYRLAIAHIGDSRGVISLRRQLTPMHITRDHNPTDTLEAERIRRSGTSFRGGRVYQGLSSLNLSRGFGDRTYKRSIWLKPHEQAVTASPDYCEIDFRQVDQFAPDRDLASLEVTREWKLVLLCPTTAQDLEQGSSAPTSEASNWFKNLVLALADRRDRSSRLETNFLNHPVYDLKLSLREYEDWILQMKSELDDALAHAPGGAADFRIQVSPRPCVARKPSPSADSISVADTEVEPSSPSDSDTEVVAVMKRQEMDVPSKVNSSDQSDSDLLAWLPQEDDSQICEGNSTGHAEPSKPTAITLSASLRITVTESVQATHEALHVLFATDGLWNGTLPATATECPEVTKALDALHKRRFCHQLRFFLTVLSRLVSEVEIRSGPRLEVVGPANITTPEPDTIFPPVRRWHAFRVLASHCLSARPACTTLARADWLTGIYSPNRIRPNYRSERVNPSESFDLNIQSTRISLLNRISTSLSKSDGALSSKLEPKYRRIPHARIRNDLAHWPENLAATFGKHDSLNLQLTQWMMSRVDEVCSALPWEGRGCASIAGSNKVASSSVPAEDASEAQTALQRLAMQSQAAFSGVLPTSQASVGANEIDDYESALLTAFTNDWACSQGLDNLSKCTQSLPSHFNSTKVFVKHLHATTGPCISSHTATITQAPTCQENPLSVEQSLGLGIRRGRSLPATDNEAEEDHEPGELRLKRTKTQPAVASGKEKDDGDESTELQSIADIDNSCISETENWRFSIDHPGPCLCHWSYVSPARAPLASSLCPDPMLSALSESFAKELSALAVPLVVRDEAEGSLGSTSKLESSASKYGELSAYLSRFVHSAKIAPGAQDSSASRVRCYLLSELISIVMTENPLQFNQGSSDNITAAMLTITVRHPGSQGGIVPTGLMNETPSEESELEESELEESDSEGHQNGGVVETESSGVDMAVSTPRACSTLQYSTEPNCDQTQNADTSKEGKAQ